MSRKEENISVAVRIRPLMRRERQQGYTEVWRTDSNRSVYCSASSFPDSYAAAKRDVKFTFDQVFGPQALNQEVYEKMGEKIVWSAMEGFNGTMFVYGQTASGKTYTMKGTKKNPGTIPLAIQDVFSYIKQTPEREFLLRVSYLEIYNEVINDLLSPENGNLKIHESPEKGVFVGGLKEEIVLSPEQVMSIIAAGEAHRHVGATNFNEMSSRSHTIFRMVIESKPVSGVKRSGNIRESTGDSSIGSPVRVSTLNLIDLAGSEKATGKGIQRQEGAFINKSLLTLGNVISRLSQKKEGHIPYRDSKLTRILEPSLSGNARIAIICTLSPTPPCFEETHNTLKFANRAKRITNRARLNEVLDDKALIQKYKNQIHELQRRLQEVKAKELEMQQQRSEVTELEKKSLEQSNATLIQRLQEQEEVRVSLEQKINRLTKLILVSTSIATPVKPPNRLWRGSTSTSSAAAAVVAGRSPAAALLSRAASFEKMNGVGGGDGLLPVISPRARRNLDLSFGIHGSPASNGVSYRHVNGNERSSSSASSDEEESEKNQAQPTTTNAENGSSSLHSLTSPPSPSSPSSSAISPFPQQPEKFRVFRGRKGSIRGSTGRDHAFTSPVSEDPGSVKRLQIRLQEQEEEVCSYLDFPSFFCVG
ncbi:Kinesin KIN-7D, mitochondrial isoform X1, variant 2 [Balamuthia mandrillaris]